MSILSHHSVESYSENVTARSDYICTAKRGITPRAEISYYLERMIPSQSPIGSAAPRDFELEKAHYILAPTQPLQSLPVIAYPKHITGNKCSRELKRRQHINENTEPSRPHQDNESNSGKSLSRRNRYI